MEEFMVSVGMYAMQLLLWLAGIGLYVRFQSLIEVERHGPLAIAAVTAVMVTFSELAVHQPANNLFLALITIGIVLTGFGGVALSMLMNIRSSLMDQLRDSGYTVKIADYIKASLVSSMSLAIFGLFCAGFWDRLATYYQLPGNYLNGAWTGMLMYLILCCYRIMNVLLLILRSPDNHPTKIEN